MGAASHQPSSSSFEGDFAPGEVLIGRYRIVALVGEGGMGQVYLADDLILGQPVAVKFLPAHVAEREGGLERFRAEVRHAREVTHPNVARVHDIGETGGRHFLTMEFVDGEDLASLLRRIGRLPREKAAQIAQQICAGLSEAHRRGVLHRDLKPANVMLDGDGHVKLTDFGLAVAAEAGEASVAGTPQYMAPEQLAGVPASVQSEVYSLGLVLYEVYTGRRALRGRTLEELRREHEEGPIAPPSSVLNDIDREVDAVLTRCLARDPAERPSSVHDVARALPGGDPLAVAIAAGETPAPEVVAAAGTQGALAPRTALALLAACIVFPVVFLVATNAERDRHGITLGKPPAVLSESERELARELTGRDPLHQVSYYATSYAIEKLRRAPTGETGDAAADPSTIHLSATVHHSRFEPQPIVSSTYFVSATDPAPGPGSAHVVLDDEGRLLAWRAREAGTSQDPERAGGPAATDDGSNASVPESTWSGLLARTGLDLAALRRVEPRGLPPVYATERRAWELPRGDEPLRIEAAGLHGRPVQFELFHGDTPLVDLDARVDPTSAPFAYAMLAMTALAAFLAWRNVRLRRAHVPGALWVGAFMFVTHVALAFGVPVSNELSGFGAPLFEDVSMALHTAVRVTLFYLALEPFARRHWPKTLIAWSRLLEGRFRDPWVGRELLVGLAAGSAVRLVISSIRWGLVALGVVKWDAGPLLTYDGLSGPINALSQLVHGWGDSVMYTGIAVFLLVVTRSLFARPWLGYGLWIAGIFAIGLRGDSTMSIVAAVLVLLTGFLLLLTRLGFLSVIGYMLAFGTFGSQRLTLQPSDWNFTSSVLVLAMVLGLVVWAFRAAMAGRPVFD